MAGKRPKPVEWAAGSLAIVFAAGIVVFHLRFEVCDQQVTSAGAVIEVCRHLQATDPPVLVFALAILTCLGAFFSEVSGFGITLKSRVSTLERGLAETKEETAEAKEGVQLALSTTAPEERTPLDVVSPIAALAARYNEIRATMSSGHARTAAMTALVGEMTDAVRRIDDIDVDAHLRSEDRGLRLAGVVYLCEHPDPAMAERLAELAMSEDKPFNTYWTLMALRASGGVLSESAQARLKRYGEELGYSDRAALINQILRPGSRSSVGR